MFPFSYITDRIAKRRDNRISRNFGRSRTTEKRQLEQHEKQLGFFASRLLMQHIGECQEKDITHVGPSKEEDFPAYTGIWSFFNPSTKEREIRIEITSLSFSRTYLAIFSQRATRKYQGWWADYQPLEASPSSPAGATAGWRTSQNSNLCYYLPG